MSGSSTARRRGRRWASTRIGSSPSSAPNPDAPKRQAGISFLVIEMNSPGIEVRPIQLIDGGYEVNEVFFNDVRVPADQLIGEENAGWSYGKFLLGNERTRGSPVSATPSWPSPRRRSSPPRRRRSTGRCSTTRSSRPGSLSWRTSSSRWNDPAARRRLLGRRQAEPGVESAEAARQRTPAGRHRDPHRHRRPQFLLAVAPPDPAAANGTADITAPAWHSGRSCTTSTTARSRSTAVAPRSSAKSSTKPSLGL